MTESDTLVRRIHVDRSGQGLEPHVSSHHVTVRLKTGVFHWPAEHDRNHPLFADRPFSAVDCSDPLMTQLLTGLRASLVHDLDPLYGDGDSVAAGIDRVLPPIGRNWYHVMIEEGHSPGSIAALLGLCPGVLHATWSPIGHSYATCPVRPEGAVYAR